MNTLVSARPGALAADLAKGFGVPRELVSQLHNLHRCQWQLEDACRTPDATPETVAIAKAAIDASNAQRHRLIDAIDATVSYLPSADADRVYSETVGELCDRLLILDLKDRALANSTMLPASFRRVTALGGHLAALIRQMLADAADGRAQLPPRFGTKVYGRWEPPALPPAGAGARTAGGAK